MSAELFDGLDDAARAELRTQLRRRDLAAGDVLCRAGDSSDCLYAVEHLEEATLDDVQAVAAVTRPAQHVSRGQLAASQPGAELGPGGVVEPVEELGAHADSCASASA